MTDLLSRYPGASTCNEGEVREAMSRSEVLPECRASSIESENSTHGVTDRCGREATTVIGRFVFIRS